MSDEIWISREIFDWEIENNGSIIIEKSLWQRAYKIWEHAKTLIENANNDFQLADGITNLKRSLNHRLKLIEDLYQLKSINFSDRKRGYLELLEQFGLVRPYIMKVLLDIRNEIEHNDSRPPEIIRCMELVDVTWYFLKSTDLIVQLRNSGASFTLYDENEDETHYGYWINMDFENNFNAAIHGWFPKEVVSFKKTINSFEVIPEAMNTKEKWKGTKEHMEKLDTDLWISGKLALNHDDLFLFLKKYFTIY